ncbi:hypothetical protein N9H39_06480 [Gammaproteobacteria bacterium]|nr:hypothetical protein [Gammaproteobacteria bacterium]
MAVEDVTAISRSRPEAGGPDGARVISPDLGGLTPTCRHDIGPVCGLLSITMLSKLSPVTRRSC